MTLEPQTLSQEQTTLGYEERFSITKPVDEESNPFEKILPLWG
jgi:hypothetical protein